MLEMSVISMATAETRVCLCVFGQNCWKKMHTSFCQQDRPLIDVQLNECEKYFGEKFTDADHF